MERKFKFHEKKLLKKVNFLEYPEDKNGREAQLISIFHIQNRDDLIKYKKLVFRIRKLANMLANLDPQDPFRIKLADQFVEKMYRMGFIPIKKSLAQCANIVPADICRRRLPVVLVRMNFCENMKEAVTYVRQGHFRVGMDIVTDPAFLVTRSLEDYVNWSDNSKVRKKVLSYNEKLDDFDFL